MRRLALVGVVLLALSGRATAQQPGGRTWQDLSPDERARAWQNYQRYRRLPERKQRELDERYQQFRALPPQEQERLRRNYQNYRSMDPRQRQQFGEKYRRWRSRK